METMRNVVFLPVINKTGQEMGGFFRAGFFIIIDSL